MANIMVVDDALFMRTLIKSILKKAGHTVIAEAKDGEEACRKYMTYRPELVTMDITMNGMDGLDALKHIIDYDKDARVIMVSAMSQKNMVFRAIKNGAKHFLIKPITVEKVVKVINEVLGIQGEFDIEKEDLKEFKKSVVEMQKALIEFDQQSEE